MAPPKAFPAIKNFHHFSREIDLSILPPWITKKSKIFWADTIAILSLTPKSIRKFLQKKKKKFFWAPWIFKKIFIFKGISLFFKENMANSKEIQRKSLFFQGKVLFFQGFPRNFQENPLFFRGNPYFFKEKSCFSRIFLVFLRIFIDF